MHPKSLLARETFQGKQNKIDKTIQKNNER